MCGFFNTRVSLWESAFRESDPPVSASGVQHAAPGLNQPRVETAIGRGGSMPEGNVFGYAQ